MGQDGSYTSALQALATRLRDLTGNLRQRRTLAVANVAPKRPDESELKKLDSSVKKNTNLVKKLKQITDEVRASLLEEIRRTNQTKYVSEAVAAIAEANHKPKDLPATVQIISLLHQRYAEFGQELYRTLAQSILHCLGSQQDEDRAGAAKQRAWLRLLAELLALQIVPEQPELLAILTSYASLAVAKDKTVSQGAFTVISGFAKAGREEFLGMPFPKPAMPEPDASLQEGEEVEVARQEVEKLLLVLDEEVKQQFKPRQEVRAEIRQIVHKVYNAACTALRHEHQLMEDIEQVNMKALNQRGDLPEDMAAEYETQRKAFDSLQKLTASLAETLGLDMPVLESTSLTRLKGSVKVISTNSESKTTGPYDDEETKAFYESLPDVVALVPSTLFNKDPKAEEIHVSGTSSPTGAASDTAETGQSQGFDEAAGAAAVEDLAAPEKGKGGEIDAAIQRILNCSSTDRADEAAIAFCYINSKGARKRLVKELLSEKTGAQQQLPLYARMIAILHPAFPELAMQLLAGLEEESDRLMAKKEVTPRMTEARLRNCRLLAELTKFKLCPYGTFFTLLKSLLDDFHGPNIDIAAAFVESAGRYLYLLPETAQRMENMLKVMVKKKNSGNLDPRQVLAVESAHIASNPPDRAGLRKSHHPPHRLYMRHLIRNCLTEDDIKLVTRKMRLFTWADNETFFVKTLLSSVKGRYAEIPLLASLAASLAKYRPSLSVALADDLLEEIYFGLENPNSGKYQRRVGHMCLLGELYNFRLLDSKTIFSMLYTILSFGHSTPEESETLDPPSNYFRVRLVCVLLATCGHYFSRGSAKVKLDRFLTYFQRYLLYKPPLPLDVEFTVQDLLEHLRPNMKRFERYEEACEAVETLEEDDAAAQEANEPVLGDQSDSEYEEEAAVDGVNVQLEDGQDGSDEPTTREVSEDDDDDQAVVFKQGVHAAPQIDEEFEKELAALNLSESRQPVDTRDSLPVDEVSQTTSFKVMLKKGGRESRTKTIQIPSSLRLAVKSQEDLAAAAAERAELKRLVLQASEDQAVFQPPHPSTRDIQPRAKNVAKGRKLEIPIEFSDTHSNPEPRAQNRAPSGRGRGGTARQSRGRGRGRRFSGPNLASVAEDT